MNNDELITVMNLMTKLDLLDAKRVREEYCGEYGDILLSIGRICFESGHIELLMPDLNKIKGYIKTEMLERGRDKQ